MTFYTDPSGSWSEGVLVGAPLLTLLVAGLLALAFWARHWYRNADRYDRGMARTCTIGLFVLGGFIAPALILVGYYPYGGEYHQYRNVGGTVESIDSRLIGGSGDTETKFVVRFEGSQLQFGCDDTRCAQVDEGDTLALSCKKSWQYTGTDGYDCRFVSTEAAA